MAEWLYEAGIGENRAALISRGGIWKARIELEGVWPRVDAVLDARLIDKAAKLIALDGGGEALCDHVPKTITQGAKLRVRITREAIPEPGRAKLPKAVPSDEELSDGPTLFDRIAAASEEGRALTLATDLATGRTQEGVVEGGFLNRYDPPRQLLIVGAVQIAQSLVPLAQAIDVRPVVIDPRGRFLTEERFPGVELDDRWPDEAIAARHPGESTAIVTLSHDIKIDDPALIAALNAPTGYIAALGSRRSHAARIDRLTAAGFDADALARIDGPAGLDIGAIGPAEIALSITAGMVAGFNARG